MKLKNKKTGEIGNLRPYGGDGRIWVWIDNISEPEYRYNSLAELNEEWEDYEPAEPLIKDEKIRKAVRAWAEANNISKVCVQNNYRLSSEEDEEVEIIFAFPAFKEYVDFDDFIAITELCGEEEE